MAGEIASAVEPTNYTAAALGSAGINAGAGVLGSFLSYGMNRELAQQSYELGQQAQKNAAVNQVESLKKAGLSPTLAAGNFQAASGITGSSVNSQVNPNLDLLGANQLQKQNELTDAQILKTKEDARAQKIKNDRDEQEDASARKALMNHIASFANDDRLTDDQKFVFAEMESDLQTNAIDVGNSWNLGTLKGLEQIPAFRQKIADNAANEFESYYRSKVKEGMIRDDESVKAAQQVDKLNNAKLRGEIYQLAGLYAKMMSDIGLNEAEVVHLANLDKQIQMSIRKDYNSQVTLQVLDGNYKQAALNLATGALNAFATGSGAGFGAAAGAGAAQKFTKGFSGRTGRSGGAYRRSVLGRVQNNSSGFPDTRF